MALVQRNCMSSRYRILNCQLLIWGLEMAIIYWSLQYLLSFASLQLVSVNRLSSHVLSKLLIPAVLVWGGSRGTRAPRPCGATETHDSSKLTPLPGCRWCMLVNNGTLVQFQKGTSWRVVFPTVKCCLKPGRLIVGPDVWHRNTEVR